MKEQRESTIRIAGERAAHALRILIAEGKIAAKDVTNALKRREALITDLRRRLAALEAGVMVKAGVGSRAKRRQRRLSAATRARYRAQGRYMAAVRRLPKAARSKVKAIREKSGVAAAIAAARKIAK